MTIYDFLEMVNDNYDTVFSLFDCNTEDLVTMATEFSRDDLLLSEYVDYEICSVDMWIDKGRIHIEFNIEVEEEEF